LYYIILLSKSVSVFIFAPESRKTSEWCQVVENRCVFSAHMKVFCDSSGVHSADSGLFQVVGR